MKKIKAVMIRIEEKKHRALRHELLDRGISFSAFVNKLIDERSLKRPGGAIKVEQQAKRKAT